MLLDRSNVNGRVLHVVECYSAGVRTVVDMAASELSDWEHVLLYTGGDSPGPQYSETREMGETIPDRIRSLRRAIDYWRPDVIHAHSSWAGVYARTLPRVDAPVVYQPHCFAFADEERPRIVRGALWLMEALLAHRTDAIISVSPWEHEQAARLSRRGRLKTYTVPNASNLPSARRALPTRQNGRIAMTGRISTQKDPAFFGEVARAASGAGLSFVWIGEGDPTMEEGLRRSGVDVTGWLEPQAIADALSSCSLYLHSARYEGFPISVADAITVRLPIVVRDIRAFRGTGLRAVQSASEAVNVIIEAHQDQSEYDRIREGSLEVGSCMTPAEFRNSLSGVYSETSA